MIESIITKVGQAVNEHQKNLEGKVDKLAAVLGKQRQSESISVVDRKAWSSIATVDQKVDKTVAAVEKQNINNHELHDCVQKSCEVGTTG
jgi:hypothetical protein